MPFKDASDPSLPANVLRLSMKRRSHWISVYESARTRGLEDGQAIRMANGVVKKTLSRFALVGGRAVEELVASDPSFDMDEFLDAEFVRGWPDEIDEDIRGFPALAVDRSRPVAVLDDEEDNVKIPLVDRMMAWAKGGGGEGTGPSSLSLRAMPDGRMRFFSFASNNFEDRGRLIFTAAGQQEYANWAERTGNYPELWLWHTRGSRFGEVDKLWFDGHVQVSTGLIDVGKEDIARSVAARVDAGEIGMSHGYLGHHRSMPDGTIEVVQFREFEQSVLPLQAAANYGTYFGVFAKRSGDGEQEEMLAKFTQEQRDWLTQVGHASPDEVSRMENLTTEMQETFKKRGIDWRSLEMEDGAPGAAAAATVGAGASTGASDPGSPGAGGEGGGSAASAPTSTQSAVTAGVGLSEADVQRIAREAVRAELEPVAAEVRSMGAGFREFADKFGEGADGWFARSYESKVAQLPRGFKASEQGAAPVGGGRAAGAAEGDGSEHSWIEDKMFGSLPILAGGANGRES